MVSDTKKSLRHSGTAAVKLLHSNFVVLYHVIITNIIYFYMTLIQISLFERNVRKENYKMSFFLLIMVDKDRTEVFYLRLFSLSNWLDCK